MTIWIVVHFLNENAVEAVPAIWMKGSNQCRWPDFGGLKLKSAILKSMPPSSDWDIFDVRIIGSEYEDLAIARMKAIEAETNTDINSDDCNSLGIRHRRVRVNKKYISDSESEDDECPPMPYKIVMPSLKKTNNKKTADSVAAHAAGSSKEYDSGEKIHAQKVGENVKSSLNDRISALSQSTEIISESVEVESTPVENSCEETTIRRVEKNKSGNSHKTESLGSNLPTSEITKDEQFRRQVLRNLAIIHFKLEQLAEDIAQISKTKIEEPASHSVFLKFDFPLTSEEGLQALEDYLSNQDNYRQVRLEFSRIGGSNVKLMVKRILDKILTSEIGMNYSWIGFKGKKNFSALLTAKVLIDAVMDKSEKSSAADVEAAVKQWLVKSKERIEKMRNKK